jgi:hypothetical protein
MNEFLIHDALWGQHPTCSNPAEKTDAARLVDANASPQADDILADLHSARRDEAAGYRGDRMVIATGFDGFDDELICIRTILRTPPIDEQKLVIGAGWQHVHPLLADRAIGTTYCQNRLDRMLASAGVLATSVIHRTVDAIISGPPVGGAR